MLFIMKLCCNFNENALLYKTDFRDFALFPRSLRIIIVLTLQKEH